MIDYLTDNPWVIPIAAIVILAVLLLVAALMLIQKRSTETDSKLTMDELVDEVLAGTWGSGETRKTALTAAGYDYDAVQAAVNERLKNGK